MPTTPDSASGKISRAQGCLLGQLAGDALGSLVEFQSADEIRRTYPNSVRELADGGTWKTIAGQPTDDSEMALILARMLVEQRRYDADQARQAYSFWLNSGPFDCGHTVRSGLRGQPNLASQANGAMMRISPLGIFGANYDLQQVAEWARQDAVLTHPNPVCLQANALFAMAIAYSISTGCGFQELYQQIEAWSREMDAEVALLESITGASMAPPSDYLHQQGWVLIAFGNALWQLLHARNLEGGVVDTVMRGGDTDTNAAITGALLGAVYGGDAVPIQWVEKILSCRRRLDSRTYDALDRSVSGLWTLWSWLSGWFLLLVKTIFTARRENTRRERRRESEFSGGQVPTQSVSRGVSPQSPHFGL